MSDMSQVIVPKSDQINADDLIAGPVSITIRDVQIRGGQEQPVSIVFEGSDKVFRPCKSMSRVLVAAWGADAKQYVGRSLTLYRDASVKWGGLEVGGIRISHMSHLDSAMTMALTATKGSRKPYTVKPLPALLTPGVDRAAEGVRTLIERIKAADAAGLSAILSEEVVLKQRAWLTEKRPELAEQIDVAIAIKFPADSDDPFASPQPASGHLPPETAEQPPEGEDAAPFQEGRGDAEMGEFDGLRERADSIIAEGLRKEFLHDLDQWSVGVAGTAEYREMPAELQNEINAALSEHRKKLAGGARG